VEGKGSQDDAWIRFSGVCRTDKGAWRCTDQGVRRVTDKEARRVQGSLCREGAGIRVKGGCSDLGVTRIQGGCRD
jgi:hypothetical protein